jgi:hypothetical protein
MKLVHSADIGIISEGKIFTMGLSTCMCFVVITKKCIIMWHFSSQNINGVNMARVKGLLDTIKLPDIIKVFLVPGIDRNEDLSLKADCRTMVYRPDTNPEHSRNWFMAFIQSYSWAKSLEILPHVNHYKELVIFEKDETKKINFAYTYGRNDDFHDSMCILDAEKMI